MSAWLVAATLPLALTACSGHQAAQSAEKRTPRATGTVPARTDLTPGAATSSAPPNHSPVSPANAGRPRARATGSSGSVGPSGPSQPIFYTYKESTDYEGQQNAKNVSSDFSMEVDPPQNGTQRIGEREGGGSTRYRTYRRTASAWQAFAIDYGPGLPGCTYSPPLTALVLPLSVGAQWHSATQCKGEGQQQGDGVDENGKVTGFSRRNVPGHGILDLWTIHKTGTLTPEGLPGLTKTTYTDDYEYAPALLVPVQETFTQRDYHGTAVYNTKISRRALQTS